jgi:hypothetical protein
VDEDAWLESEDLAAPRFRLPFLLKIFLGQRAAPGRSGALLQEVRGALAPSSPMSHQHGQVDLEYQHRTYPVFPGRADVDVAAADGLGRLA